MVKPIMKIKEILPNIFHIEADSQYELTSTFMRPQEFYESSFKEIRGKVFSLEFFMDRYAKEFGNFTYTTDWSGFNIPGHIINEFFFQFRNILLKKEKKLYKMLEKQVEYFHSGYKFYVIGTFKTDHPSTIEHEIAHALYYLNDAYRFQANELIMALPEKLHKKLTKKLKDAGYGNNVIDDEIQAHLAAETSKYIKSEYKITIPPKILKKFKKLLKNTQEEIWQKL